MKVELDQDQLDAVERMRPGSILVGGVGSGKSRTSLMFYWKSICRRGKEKVPLYIITTAQKRDKHEWEREFPYFDISDAIVDSWNNIKKYVDIKDSFFIFDEQRLIGSGLWVKSFLKISESNKWVLLTATPGDCWMDYVPVFIANKFFKNRTEFNRNHVVFNRYTKYPKVDYYINQKILSEYKSRITIYMECQRHTVQHHEYIKCHYSRPKMDVIEKDRWNPYDDEPIENVSKWFYLRRRVANEDTSRIQTVDVIAQDKGRVIIFYNFDYELEALRNYGEYYKQLYPTSAIGEWNGHKHEPVPRTDRWLYLVQYTAGAEGWNCIETDTIIFYSQSYSYKATVQAAGRIDRRNTQYRDLWYYHLTSDARIDQMVKSALDQKRDFVEPASFKA